MYAWIILSDKHNNMRERERVKMGFGPPVRSALYFRADVYSVPFYSRKSHSYPLSLTCLINLLPLLLFLTLFYTFFDIIILFLLLLLFCCVVSCELWHQNYYLCGGIFVNLLGFILYAFFFFFFPENTIRHFHLPLQQSSRELFA